MLERNIDVVVAGHTCMDITPIFEENKIVQINKVFLPGKLTNMAGIKISAAGSVPNVGITLKKLGMNVSLMGKIGNDYIGSGVMSFLNQWNLDMQMKKVDNETTSYTVVLSLPKIDRMFLHDPGTNDSFTVNDINFNVLYRSKLFHFGYPPLMKKMYENDGSELLNIFRSAKKTGVITSLDMAFIEPDSEAGKADWKKILSRVLPYVDIYIPSVEETLYMFDKEYFEKLNSNNDSEDVVEEFDIKRLSQIGDELLAMGVGIVVIKCGSRGYYLRTGINENLKSIVENIDIDINNWANREIFSEAYVVSNIKSTTGAGDSSIAGFLASLINRRTIEDSACIAQKVAAMSITTYDVFSNIQDFETISTIIESEKKKKKLTFKDDVWCYDSINNVWLGKNDTMLRVMNKDIDD